MYMQLKAFIIKNLQKIGKKEIGLNKFEDKKKNSDQIIEDTC